MNVCAIVTAIALMTAVPTYAHDGSDVISKWYRGLQQPGTNMSCCGGHDCKETDYRVIDGNYQAWITSGLATLGWITIPPDKILRHTSNPTGRAVICWSPLMGIMCFVLPEES